MNAHDNIQATTQWKDRLAMDMSAESTYGRKMRQPEKGNRLLAHVSAAQHLLSIKPRRECTSLGNLLAVELLHRHQQHWQQVSSL